MVGHANYQAIAEPCINSLAGCCGVVLRTKVPPELFGTIEALGV